MLLRASSEHDSQPLNLSSVTDSELESGVLFGSHLTNLVEATIRGEWLQLGEIRSAADAAIGAQQTVDALVVAAAFNGITRVADATGIPLDPATAAQTQEMRQSTGIDEFDYVEKTRRYQ